ncbi:DUF3857 domain-containing protein [Tenacibaculum sp. 190524A02b]
MEFDPRFLFLLEIKSMKMKRIYLLFIFSINLSICFSQKSKSSKLGNVSREEVEMVLYEKDTLANAVVLFEHGNYYLDERRDYKKTTDYYFKVKIINAEAFEKATISIPFYKDEKVHHIKGITYNLSESGKVTKTHLVDTNVYTKELSAKWKEKTFTMPNIKEGSVIEYVYSVSSPYSKIDDWEFQSDIPKVKSDFTASILGNWRYNVRIIGYHKLQRNDASVKKSCLYMPGIGTGDCLILEYGLDDIPAFKEEDYMLSAENFKSKLVFELKSFTHPSRGTEKYTKTWKDADKKLRFNFLDNQGSKKSFFKKKLPEHIFLESSELEKAKKAFDFIKKHYTWNGKYWPSQKIRVKNAFENKSGTIFDINLSLYNSLKAIGVDCNLVLTATRDRAQPTKLHPIINDFNYLFVKATVEGEVYYLDASNKYLPFGLVQFQALNGQGRILDFKKGSFWEEINIKNKTFKNTKAKLVLNEDSTVKTDFVITRRGYYALDKREELKNKSYDDRVASFESKYPYLEVDDYTVENIEAPEKILKEKYSVTLEDVYRDGSFYINPYLISRKTINPFKLEKRDYPVDFGYPIENTYVLSLKIPDGYKIKEEIKNKAMALPQNGGTFIINSTFKKNILTLFCRWNINKPLYNSAEYFALKKYFKHIIKSQDMILEIVKE